MAIVEYKQPAFKNLSVSHFRFAMHCPRRLPVVPGAKLSFVRTLLAQAQCVTGSFAPMALSQRISEYMDFNGSHYEKQKLAELCAERDDPSWQYVKPQIDATVGLICLTAQNVPRHRFILGRPRSGKVRDAVSHPPFSLLLRSPHPALANSSLSTPPVAVFRAATSRGVPVATMRPPPAPPSGPSSTT